MEVGTFQPFSPNENSIHFEDSSQISSSLFNDNAEIQELYNDILKELIYLNELDETTPYFYCQKCLKHLLFKFENNFLYNLKYVIYTCECHKDKDKIVDVLDEKFWTENIQTDIDFIEYLKCEKNHRFSHYLENSKKDICFKCYKKGSNLNEQKKEFDDYDMYKRINYLIIVFKLNENHNDNINDEANKAKRIQIEKKIKIKKFITKLIHNYIFYRNYNVYQSLINLKESIKTFKILTKKNSDIDNLFTYYIDISIKKEIELMRNNENMSNLVIEIKIQRNNINDLSILNNFNNLIKLDLRKNLIKSIKKMIDAPYKYLETLNLSGNKLNNDTVQLFEEIKFNKLKTLYLDMNLFDDFGLFLSLSKNKNLKNLEELSLSFNLFNCFIKEENGKKTKIKKCEEYKKYFNDLDFNSIKTFVLNNGPFNNATIKHILTKFSLKNIVEIQLNYKFN